jgi:hypothetical protein
MALNYSTGSFHVKCEWLGLHYQDASLVRTVPSMVLCGICLPICRFVSWWHFLRGQGLASIFLRRVPWRASLSRGFTRTHDAWAPRREQDPTRKDASVLDFQSIEEEVSFLPRYVRNSKQWKIDYVLQNDKDGLEEQVKMQIKLYEVGRSTTFDRLNWPVPVKMKRTLSSPLCCPGNTLDRLEKHEWKGIQSK